jgi:hypothetical protein
MSRGAIVILLLVAVISVSLGAYLIIFPRVQDIQLSEVKGSMVTAGRLLQELDAADEIRLVEKLSALSRRPSLRDLLREVPADAKERQGWLNKLRAEVAGLTTAARGVAPVKDFFVLNQKGVGLVRNIDLHWTGKSPSADPKLLEAIDKAGSGTRKALIVQEGESLLRAVVVPVYAGGRVTAILCATFPLDDGIAKARSGEIGLDVEFAYVTKTGVASGALSEEVRQSFEKFVKAKGVQVTKLLEGTPLAPQEFQGPAGRLLVAGTPVPAYGAEGQLGIVLARNVDALARPYSELTLWLFGGGGVCLVVLVILVLIFGGGMARGLKQLEVDALEISSGDDSRRFKEEGPAPTKPLAELLNQVLARLRGEEPEPPKEKPAGEEAGEEEPLAASAEAAGEEPGAGEGEGWPEEPEEKELAEAEAGAGSFQEQEEVGEVARPAASGEGIVAPPHDHAEVPGKAAAEVAPWEEVEEEAEVGPPLGQVAEESTAEVSLDDAARKMEIQRMQEAARRALQEGGRGGRGKDEEEEEDAEPPTRVADIGDLQALREAASVGGELELPRRGQAQFPEAPKKPEPEAEPPAGPGEQPAAGPAREPADKQALEKEEAEEERYYREMYEEFVRAKREVGDKVEKLNLDRFVRKLKKQEELLKAKHGCKGVKFQVTVRNKQVSLRPRIIR